MYKPKKTYEAIPQEVEAIPAAVPVYKCTDIEGDIARMADYCKNGKKRSNNPTSIYEWSRCIRRIHKQWPIEYSKDYIRMIRNALEDQTLNDDGLPYTRSAATIKSYLMALENLFRANEPFCNDERFRIGKPQITIQEAQYNSPEEIERLIRGIRTIRDKALITVLYFAALRNSEARNLYLTDYDPIRRTLHIRAHGDWHPKDYEARMIPVPKIAHIIIMAWMKERESIPGANNIPYMFFTVQGTRFTDGHMRQLTKALGKDAGIDTHPHALRHARASYLANIVGMPLPQLQRFLGHSNIQTTMRYVHTTTEQIQDTIDKAEEIDV